MQVIEQQCPYCNARLRLRGPAREGEKLSCPDCSKLLVVESGNTELRLIAAEATPVVLPGSPVASKNRISPTVVAWCVATAVMLPIGWSLLGPDETDSALPATGQPKIATESNGLEPARSSTTKDQPAEGSPGVPESNEPVDSTVSPVGIDPPPPGDKVLAADGQSDELPGPATSGKQVDQNPSDAEPAPTEAEEQASLQAAADATAIASIRRRFSVRLTTYQMQRPVKLRVFLDEVSRLGATWINTNGLGKSLDKLVQVRLTDTTLEAVLTEGLKQVDFQYTLGVTGIRLTTRESPE